MGLIEAAHFDWLTRKGEKRQKKLPLLLSMAGRPREAQRILEAARQDPRQTKLVFKQSLTVTGSHNVIELNVHATPLASPRTQPVTVIPNTSAMNARAPPIVLPTTKPLAVPEVIIISESDGEAEITTPTEGPSTSVPDSAAAVQRAPRQSERQIHR